VSVVTSQTRRRWATVVAGIVVLVSLPIATSAVSSVLAEHGAPAAANPTVLLRRALDSAGVPHTGLARSSGSLGLPDLPQLTNVAAVLGDNTRTRVWWAGPQSWRVDVLTPTGEQGIYDERGRTVLWNYEQARLTEVIGTSPVRLPRADDLIPPQAARRLLAGVGVRDRLEVLPERRSVAGLRADGLRIVPADRRSTIGHIDVWVERGQGLPVALDVVDTRGVSALSSRFVDLELKAPKPSAIRIPSAPGVVHDSSDAPDLAARIQQFSSRRLLDLPDSLAGIAASSPLDGAGTYGSGLVRFVVLPLPGRLPEQVLDAARSAGSTDLKLPDGEALLVSSGLINLVVARTADQLRSYLVTGLVSDQLLKAATAQLLRQPPPQWWFP
jgi:hypothetical protein